jgi:transcriptional regulator with XRE-family HTH domain
MADEMRATLKDLRRDAALSQEELAKQIDVSVLTISSWETARRYPRAMYVRLLAIALGVTIPEMVAALKQTKIAHGVATATRPDVGDSLSTPESE